MASQGRGVCARCGAALQPYRTLLKLCSQGLCPVCTQRRRLRRLPPRARDEFLASMGGKVKRWLDALS